MNRLQDIVAGLLSAAAAGLPGNRSNGRLVSAGAQRAYLLYVPESYDPAGPTPLVISLHGYAEWPAHQMRVSGWNRLAERHGFIVAYPSGAGFPRRWRMRGMAGSPADPQKDIGFISDLITHLENEYHLDPARIFVNGLSNGGGMAFVLACRLSERIAAIGGVSGAYLLPWAECAPVRAVPAVLFHGSADPIVPYHGGPSRAFNLPFPDVPAWVETLARRNGCDATPQPLPARGDVRGLHYNAGTGADVDFYMIDGGGHAWPGSEPIPAWIVGRTSRDIDATQVMWDFFQAHPLPTHGATPAGSNP